MLELLDYLRANGFKTFIVSGGGIEFMHPWTERVYGIPPEQVVGSSAGLSTSSATASRPHQAAGARPRRRQGRQADRHPEASVAADRGLRQLRRRFKCSMDERWQWTAILPVCSPHRCRTRMGLRPRVAHRQAGQGTRGGSSERMDGREHEGRLEEDLSVSRRG
jgi:hypothetical protein